MEHELIDILFTPDDVCELLKNINDGKSPGPDSLHPRVLHEISVSITNPLFIVFCTSLDWKEAIILPIYKNKVSKYLPTKALTGLDRESAHPLQLHAVK